MAVNFQLLDKQTGEAVKLVLVDELICRDVLKCEPHEKWWGGEVFDWYNTIGFQLAYGKTLEDGYDSVRKHFLNSELWLQEYPVIDSIISHLQDKYNCRSWS
jgi:hypothetical protein